MKGPKRGRSRAQRFLSAGSMIGKCSSEFVEVTALLTVLVSYAAGLWKLQFFSPCARACVRVLLYSFMIFFMLGKRSGGWRLDVTVDTSGNWQGLRWSEVVFLHSTRRRQVTVKVVFEKSLRVYVVLVLWHLTSHANCITLISLLLSICVLLLKWHDGLICKPSVPS